MLQTLTTVPLALVVDIGGYTMDYIQIKKGRSDLVSCDSLENGVIMLYNKIISKVRAAQFITSAVLLYTQHPKPQVHDGGAPAVEEAALEQMLFPILEKHPRLAAAAKEPPASPAKGPWGKPMEDDALKAISETLSAFQQG